jgi:hypothetical protein
MAQSNEDKAYDAGYAHYHELFSHRSKCPPEMKEFEWAFIAGYDYAALEAGCAYEAYYGDGYGGY